MPQRIASSTQPQAGLHTVAFRNPDGSKALIAVNANESALPFTVRWGGQSFQYTLPRESIATLTWNGAQGAAGRTGGPGRACRATASDGRVRLTWDFAALADGYTVRRADAAGGPYTTIATDVTLPEYVDTGVVNGTAYRYVVSATNGHGSSADSAPVVATPNPPRLRSAAATIEAESFDDESGVSVQGCSDGSGCGESIGYTDDGDYLKWNRVHFGDGAESVSVRVASHSAGGTLELRLDAPSGPLVGSVQIGGTGGWDNWTTLTAPISGCQRHPQPVPRVPGRSARDGGQRHRQPQLDQVRRAGRAAGSRRAAVPSRLARHGLALLRRRGAARSTATRRRAGPAARDRPHGHWFRVDMGAPQTFDRIVLDSGTGNDHARGYRVEMSNDAATWTTLATGSGTGQTTAIPLPVSTARYLRIVQTGTAGNWWSIHELDVFAPAGPIEP